MRNLSIRRRLGYAVAAILILAVTATASSAQQGSTDPGAIDGHSVWDETVTSILGTLGEDAPAAAGAGDHPGHLGWDKATGQRLNDPTAHLNNLDPESATRGADKRPALDTSRLIYRSGFRQPVTPGLDVAWTAQVAATSTSDSSGGVQTPVYGVIQFPLPFDTAARNELERAGVHFYIYVEGGGLYARMPAGALTTLRSLSKAGRVLYAGPIPLEARLESALMDKARAEPDASVDVTLQLFDPPSTAQLAQVERYLQVKDSSLHPALPLLQGRLRAGDVLALAGLPTTRWMEVSVPGKPGNLDGTLALGTDALRAEALTRSTGAGVQVAIMDSGIVQPYHTDLPASRILDQWEFYPGDDASADDQWGHGTHLAGTIGGSGAGSANHWMQGHAPGVQFLIYKLCCGSDDTGWPFAGFQDSLIRGASKGMDISNNSWGGDGYGVYSTSSEIADRAVRGEYGQPVNMVIISHNYSRLTTAPGTAKNAITVGAVKGGNWPNEKLGYNCDGVTEYDWPPADRACFSDYGPIDTDNDGNARVKPDVMAVGVVVPSTYLGGAEGDYRYFSGTSMAAPSVSGAIATLLDYYSDSNGWLFNWPETVKAMILANAADVGGDTAKYGRGLVDIYHSVIFQEGITGAGGFWGNTLPGSGSSLAFTFDAPAHYSYIRAVLTWSDPAGAAEVANDLDLYVYSNSTCSGSPVGASESSDDTVEFIQVNAGAPSGTWCALVYGYSLSEANQAFGLMVAPVIAQPSLKVLTSVSDSTLTPGESFYFYTTLTNTGNTAAGSFIRLFPPSRFTFEGADLYTSDGRSRFFVPSDLYRHVGYWHVATGASIAGAPRLVRWHFRVDNNALPGAYTLSASAAFRDAGNLSPLVNSGAITVTVSTSTGKKLYLPLTLR